jgi:hypothetical protein
VGRIDGGDEGAPFAAERKKAESLSALLRAASTLFVVGVRGITKCSLRWRSVCWPRLRPPSSIIFRVDATARKKLFFLRHVSKEGLGFREA